MWSGVEVGMLVKKDEQMLVCGEVGGMVLGMAKFGGEPPTETFSEITWKNELAVVLIDYLVYNAQRIVKLRIA